MEPFLLGSICGGGESREGIERRAECASKANITPENRSMTHNPPHPTLIPSLTPFSPFQSTHTLTHTLNCCYISFARSLTLSRCLSPSLPRSVHLFHSLFPHVYPRLPAYSHMALLTQLCHTHPTCRAPPRSDRCCSLGCASCVPTCQTTFYFG